MNVPATISGLVLVGWFTGVAVADKPAVPVATSPPAARAKPVAAEPEGGAKLTGPPQPWKDMTAQQRGKYMKEVITPKMRVAFQQFDGEEFKEFGCDTCHGKQGKARKFKMPNPDIYALPGSPAGFGALMEKKPKMMKFMAETVKPQMAALLGVHEFDPKKAEAGGFGCIACHTAKKE